MSAETSRTPRTHRIPAWLRGTGAGATAALLVLLAVCYLLTAWLLSDRVPRGTSVVGIDIGGVSGDQAVEQLDDGLTQLLATPLSVTAGGVEATLDPVTAGLDVDADATVARFVGFDLTPATLWAHVVGGGEESAEAEIDDTELTAALTALATEVDAPVVEGTVDFAPVAAGGAPAVVAPATGLALDVPAAADTVREVWPVVEEVVDLPTEITEPEVDAETVQAAVDDFATPAVSGPLLVQVADRTVTLTPAQFAPALSLTATDGEFVPAVDAVVLAQAMLAVDPQVARRPRDATVVIEGGVPTVVPAVTGVSIPAEPLAAAVLPALTAAERLAVVEPEVSQPDLTTEEAQALGIVEQVSTYSTTLTDNAERSENIALAAQAIDGTLVLPGETFSMNDIVGERTAEAGYNEAPVIVGGRLQQGVGGGVSQLATTIFNAVFFAGLEDVEHQPHSFYISRYPVGREATVNFGSIDLRFRNDTDTGILVEAGVSGNEVTVTMWGTKIWDIEATEGPRRNATQPETVQGEGEDCVSQSPQPGFDITVERIFSRNGTVERTEEFDTTYNAQDRVVCP